MCARNLISPAHPPATLPSLADTWAISKTGKISCGDSEGFHPFAEKLGPPDVIGAEADLEQGTIRFWRECEAPHCATPRRAAPPATCRSPRRPLTARFLAPHPLILHVTGNGVLLGTAFQGISRSLCLVPACCLGSNNSGKLSAATLVEFDMAWAR